ncbi:hypothetical protein CB1_060782076 [Camelus ferus]|nr:hypothetical protein CB1_060782076 [Camelus ferus]
MRPAGFRNFLLLASSLLLAGLSAVPQSFSPSLRYSLLAESERRCRAPGQPPGGALCHGRGRCDCGVCICHVSEPGVYFGPLCECHEWVCETYDGSTCAGPRGDDRAVGAETLDVVLCLVNSLSEELDSETTLS